MLCNSFEKQLLHNPDQPKVGQLVFSSLALLETWTEKE